MRRLADLAVDDVDIDDKQTPGLDCPDNRLHQLSSCCTGTGVHGILHHVCSAVVFTFEGGGVERRLVVIVGPDVMHLAKASDEQLVDVGRRPAHMRVRGPHIAFLVATQTADAATFAADVAGG